MIKKAKVFILDKVRYGEFDLILTTLDSCGGKLSFFARMAVKSKKRFPIGVLDKSNFVEVLYTKKADNDLYQLKEAIIISSFEKIRNNFEKMNLVSNMLLLIKTYAKEGVVDNSSLFNLLGNSLTSLEECDNIEMFKAMFEVKFWNIQGLLPDKKIFDQFLQSSILDHSKIQMSKGDLATTFNILDSVREDL